MSENEARDEGTDHSSSCSSSVVPDAPLIAACASSLVAYSTSAYPCVQTKMTRVGWAVSAMRGQAGNSDPGDWLSPEAERGRGLELNVCVCLPLRNLFSCRG